ncbi:hypothetical protein RJ640_006769 [Escallonia rubra]|uniref:TIR domain-containing protein n=1 Tax=Escallonia rubra TaxID=112253 RepID=A0AA88R0T0_9ASTE|nr:hypothetical protein RJ640_006769 [Escallonia rubra]
MNTVPTLVDRGEDTRKGFTDNLYTALVNAGLSVFRDNDEIERGEYLEWELDKAIKGSQISIIVFSKHYASSKWCLDELVMILDRKDTSRHTVLPVFYDVEPSKDESVDANILVIYGMGGIGKTTIAKIAYNLNFFRFDSSSFVANVKQHSEQFNGIFELQKQVLSNILKGEKGRLCNVHEGSIKISQAICSKRVLVVLDDVDKLDQFDALLGTRVFYPGSKIILTTRKKGLLGAHVAHKVHMIKSLSYDESLELSSLHAFGQDHPMDGFVEQSERLVRRCEGFPLALQVLSSSLSGKSIDVWEATLSKLEEVPHTDIQKVLEISYDTLQDDYDKNLFLHIACFFIGEEKDDTFKILEKCGLHPTVGIDSLIDRCLLTVKNGKLMMHRLLQEMGKEIVRKESPKEPGRRSRLWCHKDSFRVLNEKLVKSTFLSFPSYFLTLCKYAVGYLLFFIFCSSFFVYKGTKTIEGLTLDVSKLQRGREACNVDNAYDGASLRRTFSSFISWERMKVSLTLPNKGDLDVVAFARIKNILLLQLNYVQLTGNYKDFPRKLRWLCWHGFPLKHVPIDISLENLVKLDLRHSKLEQFWQGNECLGFLKTLDLSHSQRLARTFNFSKLPNLEKLILKGCVGLLEVCESIGFLKRLDLLDLQDCTSLKKLPSNIGLLNFLQELNISGCSNLVDLPVELGKMKSLSALRANNLSLKTLPSATGEVKSRRTFFQLWVSKPERSVRNVLVSLPSSLVDLSLQNCNLSDDSFPKSFGNLSSLTKLDLGHNPIHSLPDCIRSLNRLECLNLDHCIRLQSIEGLPNAVTMLFARRYLLAKPNTFGVIWGKWNVMARRLPCG